MPQCYENTNLSVELQYEGVESCFIRHEDGTVTCPNRCTDGKSFKTVKLGPNTTYVPVIMYKSPRYPLQEIPRGLDTPYNAYMRRKRKEARVMIFVKRDVPKQKLRMQVSEHPFGTFKWYDGYHFFLCKGEGKVGAETAMAYLSYNMRRAINLLGVAALIAHFQGIASQQYRG